MNNYEKKQNMIDSGVEWIGEIPEGWGVVKMKEMFSTSSGKYINKNTEEGDFLIYGANGVIGCTDKYNINSPVILVGRVGSCGSLHMIKKKVYASDNALILKPKQNKKIEFIFFVLKTFDFEPIISKTSQPLLTSSALLKSEAPLPPLETQTRIADFLDHETALIDKERALIKKKVALLKDKRKTLIFACVTGKYTVVEAGALAGSDTHDVIGRGALVAVPAPSKGQKGGLVDSGVEWIGEIPEGWEIAPLKTLFHLKGGGCDKKINDGEEMVNLINFTDVFNKRTLNNQLEYMQVSCKKEKIKDIKVIEDDLLITPSSETALEIGIVNRALEDIHQGVFSYHILRMRKKKNNVNCKYFNYFFDSTASRGQFLNKATGTTRVTLSRRDINSNILTLPPLETQTRIADFLDYETSLIDQETTLLEKKHALLEKRRQALIFECVTGKKDI